MRDINILTQNGVNTKKALELFGTIEKYDKVIEAFCDSIDEKLEQLKNFKAIADLKQYAILSHALKSEAGFFGCQEFYDLAYKHEIAGKNNDLDFINSNYDILVHEIKKVTAIFNKYLGREADLSLVQEPLSHDVNEPKKKIIVVDDSINIPFLIQQVFNDRFEVILKKDLNEIMNMTVDNVIGLILNMQMTSANPTEVFNYFVSNALFSKIPLCVATNNETNIKVVESINGDILRIPFTERDIKAKVEKFLIFHK